MNRVPEILAYYYPGWVSGRGFCEWQVVAGGQRVFSSHRQPRRPLIQYDVEDPGVLEGQIQTALSAGIRGFVFCWYWDNGRIHLDQALHRFLHVCPQYPEFQFALMWVNRLPHKRLPLTEREVSKDFYEAFSERIVKTSESDLRAIANYCHSRIWSHPNHVQVDGHPLFIIFSVRDLLPSLDASSNLLGVPLDHLCGCLQRSFGREPYLTGIAHGLEYWLEDADSLGFNALTSYVLLPDWHGPQRQDYARYAFRAALQWDTIRQLSMIPYFPSVTVGWDASCRGKEKASPSHRSYPWAPVIINDGPDKFLDHLVRGLIYGRKNGSPYLLISSWNEWSEGHYLEPDKNWGTAALEAVRKARYLAENSHE